MHNANLKNSKRLQRVLAVLQDGRSHTTRQIIRQAHVCAVNSIISELRANGIMITCKPVKKGRFEYQLLTHPCPSQEGTNKNEKFSVDK
jgi:hypothetical protein